MDSRPLVSLALVMVVVWARVEPPANVTLQCQSMNNVLKWEYEQNTPGLRFRVDIGAYYGIDTEGFRNVSWVEPPALEADLSFLSDPSDAYLLTVTAVVGDQESDPAPSKDGLTFSYYQDAEVNQKCFVDLPSVDVTMEPHDKVKLRFQHPWLTLYEQPHNNQEANTRRKRSHDAPLSDELPVFKYEVTIVSQEDNHPYECEDEVCEELLPVDPDQDKHCLQISGDLNHMLVKGSQVFCAQSLQAQDLTYVYVGTGLLAAVFVLTLIFYMVYRKKTKPSRKALCPGPLNMAHQSTQQTWDPVQESITVMEVESPTPLLKPTDTQDYPDVTFPETNSADYTLRMRLGLPFQDDGESDAVEEESAYQRGGSLDEDDFSSSYEKRGVPVQLGPDDQAEGYRG